MVEREQILDEIRRVANQLGTRALSKSQFARQSSIKSGLVERRFGTWNKAIEAAGLIPDQSNKTLSPEQLMNELHRVVTELDKFPTRNEFAISGNHSPSIFERRWGNWTGVGNAYHGWRTGGSIAPLPRTSGPLPSPFRNKRNTSKLATSFIPSQPHERQQTLFTQRITTSRRRSEYGEPIDFRGLRHAPINEQGVVYLFGMISRELGFLVEAVRTDFPDCEAKREIRGRRGRWETVRIEFEFKSATFKIHGHKEDDCDLIICWEHDWSDCPLEVLELKTAIKYLSTNV